MSCSKIVPSALSPPPSSISDPFQNLLVFKLIMEYVSTDHHALLMSRLVSHNWNKMALSILKINGATLGIGGDRARFIAQSHTGQRPGANQKSVDYLKKAYDRALENSLQSLQLDSHIQLATAFDYLPFVLYPRPMETLLGSQILRQTPARVVTSIIYNTTFQGSSDPMVWQMVVAAAPTLKSFGLNVTETQRIVRMYAWPNELQTALKCTVFPNLVNFWVQQHNAPDLSSFILLAYLMAGQSPNMNKFRFGKGTSENSRCKFPASPSQLRKLLPSAPKIFNHHELEVPLSFLTSITPDGFPGFRNLHLLRLVLPMDPADLHFSNFALAINALLAQNPVAALSLDIMWSSSGVERGPYNVNMQTGKLSLRSPPGAQQVNFPPLPSLVHFGIGGREIDMRLTMEVLRNVARQCLNVKSLSMDRHMFWCLATMKSINPQAPVPGELVPWYTQVTFPCVHILQLTGQDTSLTPMCEPSKMVNALFPALNEIVIDNGLDLFFVLRGLVRIRGVRELEFKAYYENWLGKRGVGLEGSELAQSLEHLKLGLPDQRFLKKSPLKPKPFRVQDLEDILKYLPNLKELEIHHKLLQDRNRGVKFSAILDEVQELRKQFPNVDIKLM